MKHLHVILLATLALGLGGCISSVPLDPTFKQTRGSKVAVVTMKAPKAVVSHIGGQGLLDLAINQATASGRNKALASYPSQAKLDGVGARFVSRLNAKGYRASLLPVHPETREINPLLFKSSERKALPGRDTYLRGYNSVLYLQAPIVGQQQAVYGFVPLSGRSPVVGLQGAMYANPDGRRLWRSPLGRLDRASKADTGDMFKDIDAEFDAQGQALESNFFQGW